MSASPGHRNDGLSVEELQRLFLRIDLCVGHVLSVSQHPNADELYVLQVDTGETRPDGSVSLRTIVTGLTRYLPEEAIQSKLVVVVRNMKPARLRGIVSQGMLLCAYKNDSVEPIHAPASSAPGDIVAVRGKLSCMHAGWLTLSQSLLMMLPL